MAKSVAGLYSDKKINVGGQETEQDWISEPRRLIECAPKFEDTLEAIQDHRAMLEEARKLSNARAAAGMTKEGSMMKVACFPQELYAAIVQVNPFFLKDKREFYRWLNKNPYYRAGGYLGF